MPEAKKIVLMKENDNVDALNEGMMSTKRKMLNEWVYAECVI